MTDDKFLENLERVLREYEHYKYMTAGFFSGVFTRNHGMSWQDFTQWIKNRPKL